MVVTQKRITTFFTLVALLLVLSLHLPLQNRVTATEVFSDNFNDGNYDGWGTYGFYRNDTENLFYPAIANFSAADQTLKATGPTGSFPWWTSNVAYISSSLAYGNWSFDVLVDDQNAGFIEIQIIADHYSPWRLYSAFPPPKMNACYSIEILTHAKSGWNDRPTIFLTKYVHPTFTTLDYYETGPSLSNWSTAWNHIDVTRNSTSGRFEVYLNGTLRLEASDNAITTSNYFAFWAQSGQALDNVIFDDGIIPTPPPTPGFPAIAIAIGLALGLGLIVIVRRRRS